MEVAVLISLEESRSQRFQCKKRFKIGSIKVFDSTKFKKKYLEGHQSRFDVILLGVLTAREFSYGIDGQYGAFRD